MAIRQPDEYLWKPSAIMNSPRVEELSAMEELWYRRALDRAYDDVGLPADPVKAAKRIARDCTPEAAEKILEIFFVQKKIKNELKMVNLRQETARKRAINSLKKFSAAGKESGRKRREKKKLGPEQRSNDVQTSFDESQNIDEKTQKKAQKNEIKISEEKNSSPDNYQKTNQLDIEQRSNDVGTINKQTNNALKDPSYEGSKESVSVLPACEIFVGTVTAEISKRLDLKVLSTKLSWQTEAEIAFKNQFTADDFLECFDLLAKQRWRDGPIKPKHVTEYLPNLNKLRKEIEKQSNGQNSNGNKTTPQTPPDPAVSGSVRERLRAKKPT
jgi:hypothetical protein